MNDFVVPDVTELMTKGFIKVKGFVSPAELEVLKKEYYNQLSIAQNTENYAGVSGNTNIIKSDVHNILKDKVEALNRIIYENTDIKIDWFIRSFCNMFDTQRIANPWHTDHEPYYIWQNSYNIIAYWVPIIKPHIDKSNLVFFPRNKMPGDLDKRTKTIGAQYCHVLEGNKTSYWECESDIKETWDFNIEDYAELVEVEPGDVIVFRDDTIHRSQDLGKHSMGDPEFRVAMAFRCIATNSVITKEQLLHASPMRQEKIDNPTTSISKMYTTMLNAFNAKGVDKMTIREFFDYEIARSKLQ